VAPPDDSSEPKPRASAARGSAKRALPTTIGRYEVARVIGSGAMGRVYLAHDPVLDRDVAVKVLRDDLRIPDDVRDGLTVRMRHEARAAARVAHPNLVTLHDMGEDPEVGLFLVFEQVVGPTLKERVAQGPMPAREASELARQLGTALSYAHRAGILHRDVKPENIMLAETGSKLTDFGIARIPDSTLTHQGGLLGTPAYSAPETFRAGKFSPESDQFSLAASLYEAIAGKRAFPGDDAVSVAGRIAAGPPEPIARATGHSVHVDEVLARAMAKEPKDRFPSCDAFGEALARALAGHAALESMLAPPGVGGRARRGCHALAPARGPRRTLAAGGHRRHRRAAHARAAVARCAPRERDQPPDGAQRGGVRFGPQRAERAAQSTSFELPRAAFCATCALRGDPQLACELGHLAIARCGRVAPCPTAAPARARRATGGP
jgi:tRNA A-37 threonylcarbamoyl transferase component Bud32